MRINRRERSRRQAGERSKPFTDRRWLTECSNNETQNDPTPTHSKQTADGRLSNQCYRLSSPFGILALPLCPVGLNLTVCTAAGGRSIIQRYSLLFFSTAATHFTYFLQTFGSLCFPARSIIQPMFSFCLCDVVSLKMDCCGLERLQSTTQCTSCSVWPPFICGVLLHIQKKKERKKERRLTTEGKLRRLAFFQI